MQISKRLAEAEQTEMQISTAREKYRPVATRGILCVYNMYISIKVPYRVFSIHFGDSGTLL